MTGESSTTTATTTTNNNNNMVQALGGGGGVEQWDLTSVVSPYLDRHMIFPLLEYVDSLIQKEKVSYNAQQVAAARLALLRPTAMVDYAIDTYKSVHGIGDSDATIPPEMQQQKDDVYQQLEKLTKGCEALTKLCDNKEERVSFFGGADGVCCFVVGGYGCFVFVLLLFHHHSFMGYIIHTLNWLRFSFCSFFLLVVNRPN
jgi:eIF3 subunit 6 N terminal domain